MAFIKNGDAEPILGHFDSDGNEQICPKCGNKIDIIALGNSVELMCESCDINEGLSSND